MTRLPLSQRVAAVTALDDPVRRALFKLVTAADGLVSRDAAATTLGLARSTAAYHLDRLADTGLVAVEFKRLGDKKGPGAGRPTKLYSRTQSELSVSVPDRHYELAGEIMATAIDESQRTGTAVDETLRAVAESAGAALGAAAGSLERMLVETGYEPRPDSEGGFDFGNCPFHRLAQSHTNIICGLNERFLDGALAGSQDAEHRVEEPRPGSRCCARIARRSDL